MSETHKSANGAQPAAAEQARNATADGGKHPWSPDKPPPAWWPADVRFAPPDDPNDLGGYIILPD